MSVHSSRLSLQEAEQDSKKNGQMGSAADCMRVNMQAGVRNSHVPRQQVREIERRRGKKNHLSVTSESQAMAHDLQ